MDCYICLSDENNFIKCSNNNCSSIICNSCFEEYFYYCLKNNSELKCECDIDYFYKNIPKQLQSEFLDYKYNFIKKTTFFPENKEQDIKTTWIIKKRTEKINFLKTFPVCISETALIAFKEKLKRVGKCNEKFIFNKVIKCPELVCTGQIIDNTCNECFIKICTTCGISIKTKSHKCKKEDIESFKELSEYSNCPKCNVIYYKVSGCEFLTCNNCKTKFKNHTGELTSYGGHAYPLHLKNHDLVSLYPEFDQELLKQIISKKPKMYSFVFKESDSKLKVVSKYELSILYY